VLELPGDDGTLATRGARLALAAGEVAAVDADGNPALVVTARGPGRVVTCAYPVELLLARVTDAHGPTDRAWGLYAGLAALSRLADHPRVDSPEVAVGSLRGPRGGAAVLTNHGPAAVEVTLHLPDGARRPRRAGPTGEAPAELAAGQTPVSLEPYGAAIVAWDRNRA
jgi:hypothetical protein